MREPTAKCPDAVAAWPTKEDLEATFVQKYGSPDATGWSPRRRHQFGYYLPADYYESLVAKLFVPDCAWIDVGGGHAMFPENLRLTRELSERCSKLVAVDPSDNVQQNEFVHERVQCLLEDYDPGFQFDLATIRMVVEHVENPVGFTAALARLVKPGGHVVVFTVNRGSPIALVSWLMPFRLHHPIKRMFWGGEEKDTFPVRYRMNTRRDLQRYFEKAGFEERSFGKLDDLSTFSQFRRLNYLELLAWNGIHKLGFRYPENCLLGAYRRCAAP